MRFFPYRRQMKAIWGWLCLREEVQQLKQKIRWSLTNRILKGLLLCCNIVIFKQTFSHHFILMCLMLTDPTRTSLLDEHWQDYECMDLIAGSMVCCKSFPKFTWDLLYKLQHGQQSIALVQVAAGVKEKLTTVLVIVVICSLLGVVLGTYIFFLNCVFVFIFGGVWVL